MDVGEDFNVILREEENIAGLPVLPLEYQDFASCVNPRGIFDLGYLVEWRADAECIFKRPDRIFVNLSF